MSVLDPRELQASPLADLHALAAELGLEGFRRLRKDDLIKQIVSAQGGEMPVEEDEPEVELAEDAAPVADEAAAEADEPAPAASDDEEASDDDSDEADAADDEREEREEDLRTGI